MDNLLQIQILYYIYKYYILLCCQDDEISKDEWFKMWSDCADKVLANKEFPYWLSSYMGFMFDAADTSGIPLLLILRVVLSFLKYIMRHEQNRIIKSVHLLLK